MQIVMLDSVALAHGSYRQGQVYDLSETRAKKMISKGLARSVVKREVRAPVKRKTSVRN